MLPALARSPFQSRLAYPAGATAGFDPNHPAAAFVSKRKFFSGVASGGNIVSVLESAIGVIAGTPSARLSALGPLTNFTSSGDTVSFAGQSTAAATSITFAGIVQFDALNAGSTFNSIVTTEPNINGTFLNSSGGTWAMQVNNTTISSAFVPAINTPYFFVCSNRAGAGGIVNFLFLNLQTGQVICKTAAATASAGTSSGTYYLGNNAGASTYPMLGSIAAIAYVPKYMTMLLMQQWAADPWGFWYPRSRLHRIGASSLAAYTLPITTGAYVVGGVAVGLLAARKLAITTGAYVIGGNAVGLKTDRRVAITTGAYVVGGNTVNFLRGYRIPVAGSYVINGNAVGLTVAHKLAITTGSYAISGNAVGLARGYKLAVTTGAYVIAGNAVGSARAYVLSVNTGAYTINGIAVGLTYSAAAPDLGTHGLPFIVTTGPMTSR